VRAASRRDKGWRQRNCLSRSGEGIAGIIDWQSTPDLADVPDGEAQML
jgi:hypothetical protein